MSIKKQEREPFKSYNEAEKYYISTYGEEKGLSMLAEDHADVIKEIECNRDPEAHKKFLAEFDKIKGEEEVWTEQDEAVFRPLYRKLQRIRAKTRNDMLRIKKYGTRKRKGDKQ